MTNAPNAGTRENAERPIAGGDNRAQGIIAKADNIAKQCDDLLWTMRINEYVGWAAMVLAVIGVVLNNYRLWPCFVLWMASNAMSAWIHGRTGPAALMVRDVVFFGLAACGLWQWTH